MGKGKVLIIDDNPVIVRMTESLLRAAGYMVCHATTGPQGFELAQREKPDLILLDIILPDMHGFEVCKKLRQESITKNTPIIYITASGLEEVAASEPEVQGNGCLSKPFGNKELLEVVERFLEHK